MQDILGGGIDEFWAAVGLGGLRILRGSGFVGPLELHGPICRGAGACQSGRGGRENS